MNQKIPQGFAKTHRPWEQMRYPLTHPFETASKNFRIPPREGLPEV
jgi:hypothetical protein